jgi:hypothetical protein
MSESENPLTSTLSSRPSSTTPSLRSDQRKLVDTLTALLEENPGLLSANGTVAVLRGFDRNSRAARGAVQAVVREHGGRALDIAPVPGLGELAALPAADLVVAVSASCTVPAERCAAFWGVPVLTLAGLGSDHGALTITTDDGRTDVLVRELRLTGLLNWSDSETAMQPAENLVVRPTDAGAVVTAAANNVKMTVGEVVIEVEGEVVGEVDGNPHLVTPGRYHLRPAVR